MNIYSYTYMCQYTLLTAISPLGTVRSSMKVEKGKKEKPRKTYAVSFNRELMLEMQHLALDEDRFVNDLLEEAAIDLLKKYREKRKE